MPLVAAYWFLSTINIDNNMCHVHPVVYIVQQKFHLISMREGNRILVSGCRDIQNLVAGYSYIDD